MRDHIDLSELTAEERTAFTRAMTLDEKDKYDIYGQICLEKWSAVPDGKGGKIDWLGKDSVELGFPELKTKKSQVVTAMLLENQLRFQRGQMMHLSNGMVDRAILQDTSTADEALPTTFSLAMVRRAYALINVEDWAARQPLSGPTGFVWYLDFLREADSTNILSSEYGAFNTAEAGIPAKVKMALKREVVTAEKNLAATTWTLEASEDAMAQLGLNIEQELITEFTAEFVRNIFARHLQMIINNIATQVATGTSLSAPWSAAQATTTVPGQGALSLTDWKQAIYNALVDANKQYVMFNRRPADGIVCGLDMAARFQKANQAVDVSAMSDTMDSDLGVNSFGHFAGRFHIWATDLLLPNQGFLYRRNADSLRAGFIYAPYVPIQVMPAIYGGYSTSTGAYTNTDEYTRNIRERSAEKLTKPYAFTPLTLG